MAILAAVLMAACAGGPGPVVRQSPTAKATPAPTAIPSPVAYGGPLAVLELFGGFGQPYYILGYSFDGARVLATTSTARSQRVYWPGPSACPSGGCPMGALANRMIPETSTTSTHVYFLVGDSSIYSIGGDNTVVKVRDISTPPNSLVAFAVSPDDQQIAIAVITYATSSQPVQFSEVIYTDGLTGGGSLSTIYQSSSRAEWPVSWHGNDVVLAVGSAAESTSYGNPYGAAGYEVVDPTNSAHVATLDCARGTLVAAGVACATGWCSDTANCAPSGTLGKQGWDGARSDFALPSGSSPQVLLGDSGSPHLSPDGKRLAAEVMSAPTIGTTLFQSGQAMLIRPGRAPLGWLDDNHIAVGSGPEIDFMDLQHGTESVLSDYYPTVDQKAPLLVGILPAPK